MGALSVMGSSVVDSHTSPCLCLDSMKRKQMVAATTTTSSSSRPVTGSGSLELGSSFLDSSCRDWRVSSRARMKNTAASKRQRRLLVVSEVAGQYEDSFDDVKLQILNYFTYKAVRTVLNQLYEMNPTQYSWFYNFVAANKPGDGKRFIQILVKKCNHTEIYQEISNENLELMRERLKETVIWPADDATTENI